MAFNPFEVMRAKSKTMLAILTIFIMVLFVLGSGLRGGDFFQDILPRWLGWDRTGDKVVLATIDGHDYKYSQLEQIRTERTFANQYMLACKAASHASIFTRLSTSLAEKPTPFKFPEDLVQALTQLARARKQMTDPDPNDRMAQFAQFLYQNTIQQTFPVLQRYQTNPPKEFTSIETETLSDVFAILQYDFTNMRFGLTSFPGFSGLPNETIRDEVDFALVVSKADEMGINIPPQLLTQMINTEMNNRLSAQDAARIEQNMRNRYTGFSIETLSKGISNEFKARLVLKTLAGFMSQTAPSPSYVTPRDLFDYYKQNCSLSNFWLLEFPIEKYLVQVKTLPTSEELKALFNKYRLAEYNPRAATPGFKDPYKTKVEWISGSAEAPYYAKNLAIIKASTLSLSGLIAADTGGLATSAFAVAAPLAFDAAKMSEYYQDLVKEQTERNPWDRFFSFEPRETSKNHPSTLSAVAGALAPSASVWYLGAQTVASFTVYDQISKAIEARDRVKVGLPIVLSPLIDGPFGYLHALAPSAASIPNLPPISAYLPQFQARLTESLLAELFKTDMANLTKELRDIGLKIEENSKPGKTDLTKIAEAKAEATKKIAEFVKARGLQTGQSTELRDKYTLVTDAGLKGLTDKVAPPRISEENSPWRTFFYSDLKPVAQRLGEKDPLVYNVKYFPDGREPAPVELKRTTYLAWRTEIVEPKVYESVEKSPESIKLAVNAAWKAEKARELAKKDAETWMTKLDPIADKNLRKSNNVNGFKGEVDDELRKLGAIQPRTFGLNAITRLKQQQNFGANPQQAQFYTDYLDARTPPPTDLSGEVPFPGLMSRDLVVIRNEPAGKIVLLADEPKDKFFVTILTERIEKTSFDFGLKIFTKTSPSALTGESDPLYATYAMQDAERAQRGAFLDLLKVQFKYSENKEELDKTNKERESDNGPPMGGMPPEMFE
jgi:hypothetical protein